MYTGKDITKVIAGIMWFILAISYIINAVSVIDVLGQLKGYSGEIKGFYIVYLVAMILAVLLSIAAMIYMFTENTAKFALVMMTFGVGYILTVAILLFALISITDGNFKYIMSFIFGNSATKYAVAFVLMLIFVVTSIFAQGVNYRKAAAGVPVGSMCFSPLVFYGISFICCITFEMMIKHDLEKMYGSYGYTSYSGSQILSQSGWGIAIWIGMHISACLYIMFRERFYGVASSRPPKFNAYGQPPMGYGGAPGFGQPPQYGRPPRGFGQPGYGQPPMGYGDAPGFGQPPQYGRPPVGYGQPGYVQPPMGYGAAPGYEQPTENYEEPSEDATTVLTQDMDTCPGCGNKLTPGSRFCSVCGYKIM